MPDKVEIQGNYLVVSDTVSGSEYIREPKNEVKFKVDGFNYKFYSKYIKPTGSNLSFLLGSDKNVFDFASIVDKDGSPYASESEFKDFLSRNTISLDGQPYVYMETINGDLLPVFVDTNRGNRVLSVVEFSITMGENTIGNNDWFITAGNAQDADSCFIAKRDLLITSAWFNCENAISIAKGLNLWIDGSLNTTLFTTTATTGYQQSTRDDLSIPVSKGQRIRFRGDSASGQINDTVMNISGHYEKR